MELLLLNLIFILAKTRASIKLARFDKTLCKSPDEMYSHQYDVLYAFTQVWKKNNFIRYKRKTVENVFICTLSKMAASYDVMKIYTITPCRIKRIYHCTSRYMVYVKLLAIRLFY